MRKVGLWDVAWDMRMRLLSIARVKRLFWKCEGLGCHCMAYFVEA